MTKGSDPLNIRPAEEGDIPALAELFNLAFPGERSVEERARGLRHGGVFGGLETTWVADARGQVAGAFRAYALSTHLHGREWPTLGLASVAVSPAFRRRGIGRRMCEEAHRIGRARGDLLSILYPFRVSFYAALGYAIAGIRHRYRFRVEELRTRPGWERVEWHPRSEDPDGVRAVYGRVARRSNGLLTRSHRMWEFPGREPWSTHVHRDPEGRVTGYLVAAFRKAGQGGGSLRVRELLAETREARDGLLGWIAAQRDQVARVSLDTLPSEEFWRMLSHPARAGARPGHSLWFESSAQLLGPMVRVLDPRSATAITGGDAEAAATDETDPESLAAFSERFVAGRVQGMREPDGWEPVLGLRDFRMLDEF